MGLKDDCRSAVVSLLWRKAGAIEERKHHREIGLCRDVETKLAAVVEYVFDQAIVAVNDGELESRTPSITELDRFINHLWPHLRAVVISISNGS